MSPDSLSFLIASIFLAPAAGSLWLGSTMLCRKLPKELTVARVVGLVCWYQVVTALFLLVSLWREPSFVAHFGNWYDGIDYAPSASLVWDALSAPFVLVSTFLCAMSGYFAGRYLHREVGYHRFFLMFLLFTMGLPLLFLAGTTEFFIAGWEIVGFSSVMLIGFFQFRVTPVKNGLTTWITYRISDLGLLAGAAAWHSVFHSSDVPLWGAAAISDQTAVAVLLIIAALTKSAQFPASPWLSLAMEGPTPSSAIFYGALSVHAGPYLLLRFAPLFEHSVFLSTILVAIGAITAIYASLVGSTKTDAKSMLAYATMTQLGIIFIEIGLGWRTLALWHCLAHCLLRLWQFLRAPSLLQDAYRLQLTERFRVAWATQDWLYRHAMHGVELGPLLRLVFLFPLKWLAKIVDKFEGESIEILERGPLYETVVNDAKEAL